ncbi:serine hydrolase [Aurantiacibacter sediminis]|uniref:Serine hydrolase n=1 Tax=Aurantiacibacter sediminis TaxID=2793064 RepID=A0ABS0N3U6_9SPHN|nr:serine hydrolase [Aurantiacibacter sediminis]MBH5322643.1 serine hydrolase [Aurantiacibacter sediminis]
MPRLILAAAAALALIPSATSAQEEATLGNPAATAVETRAQDLVPAMRADIAYEEVFADVFRNSISEDQFLAIRTQLESQFGQLVGLESVTPVSETNAELVFRFEDALANGLVSVQAEAPHLVTGFRLTDFQPLDDSPEGLLADLEALPGEASLLITRLGAETPLLAYNANSQLALGSTFKLYVLSALTQAIAAGNLAWDDVIELDQSSYPSGQMQDWPSGSPVTLHTLAVLMISISDNTATDQLIEVLGREAIEAEVAASGHDRPELNSPFMTTRELFVLKSGGDEELAAYRAMNVDERRDALNALTNVDRDTNDIMAAFSGGPNAIDIEWFASSNDIAALFERIRDAGEETALGVMAVNPSLSSNTQDDWRYAGFKGGSEPGVLNFSWLLQDQAGEWWTITMGWNNPDAEVDMQQFELLSARAVALAADF